MKLYKAAELTIAWYLMTTQDGDTFVLRHTNSKGSSNVLASVFRDEKRNWTVNGNGSYQNADDAMKAANARIKVRLNAK